MLNMFDKDLENFHLKVTQLVSITVAVITKRIGHEIASSLSKTSFTEY